jgi:hypothetical protein
VNRLAAHVAQDTLDQRHALAAAGLRAAGPVDAQRRAVGAGGSGLADLALGQGIAKADIHRRFSTIPANDSQKHIRAQTQMRIIFMVKNVAGTRLENFYFS